jgi:hypothetical protein
MRWSLFTALTFLASALAACLLAPPAGMAQGDKGLQLLFSTNPKEPTEPMRSLLLRPNVTQEFFLYVQNMTGNPRKVKVELQAGGQPVANGTATLEAQKGANRVVFAAASPAPGPGQPPPAPAVKGPALAKLEGPIQVRLFGDKGEPLDVLEIGMGKPYEHVDVDINYYPGEKKGKKNTLEVKLEAKGSFFGPPCRVELVLRPDRIPGLVEGQRKEGSYAGYLKGKGSKLILEAQDLQFRGDEAKGLVYLTIDGYERAMTYYATFAREGGKSTPERIVGPVLRLNHAPAALPAPNFTVGVEADNLVAASQIELGLYRNASLEVEEGGLTKQFAGDRQVQVFFGSSPEGGLLFEPKTQDWNALLDTSGIFGRRALALRLIGKGKEILVLDSKKIPKIESFRETDQNRTKEIVEPLILDGTPPEGVKLFVDLPKVLPKAAKGSPDYQLPRGAPLPLKATGEDPESDIVKVVFFAGKPAADGKLPANVVEGSPTDEDRTTWVAQLPVATDKKGSLEVSVQFTNGVGLTASDTIVIQLVDAPPGAAAKTVIEGVVTEGDRPTPNVAVVLKDDKGAAKETAKTDKKGYYVFQDVAPGSYRVTASRVASRTTAEAAVQIQAGQKKTVNLQLKR